jgi:kynureninase
VLLDKTWRTVEALGALVSSQLECHSVKDLQRVVRIEDMVSLDQVAALDAKDPLAQCRKQFYLPEGVIYLDGNSLGAAPLAAFDALDVASKAEWAEDLIASWSGAGWWTLGETLGDKIAPLVGASDGEVVVCDSTTVNLYKALHAALSVRPDRTRLVTETKAFPTDGYAAEGVAATRPDLTLEFVDVEDAGFADTLDESVAAVLVNHVDYRTASLRDMERVTHQVHDVGAIVVWDLCHSVGVIDVDLEASGVDFAVGCTYKFLNGGPGAPSFIYAAPRHHDTFDTPLQGWWGHAAPFSFEPTYRGAPGIRRFMVGTQPILSMRAMSASLDMYATVDMADIRAKSQSLTGLFIDLLDQECSGLGLELATTRDADRRGSQVSLYHEHGRRVSLAVTDQHVHGGYREPGLLRFGFAPLYNTHQEVWDAVTIMKRVLETEMWRDDRFSSFDTIS